MKKTVLVSVIILLTLSFTAVPAFSQSVEDILAKWTESSGGKAKLLGVKSRVIKGSLDVIPQGMTVKMKLYWKEGKIRADYDSPMGSIARVYDGKKAYIMGAQTMGKVMKAPEALLKEMKRQSIGDDVIINPKKYGVTYAFKGKQKVKEVDCLVLEQSFADGHKQTVYLDAKTYLPFMQKAKSMDGMGGQVEQEIYFSAYKKVNGIMAPYKFKIFNNGMEFIKVEVAELKYNSKIEDSLFVLKEQAPAAPAAKKEKK